MMTSRALFYPFVVSLCIACSAAGSDGSFSPQGNTDASQQSPDADVLVDSAAPLDDSSAASVGEVYAHSATTLYRLDPISKSLATLGAFDCVTADLASGFGMWDIAVDKNGSVFGSVVQASGNKLVHIDKTNASCTTIATAKDLPNSLAFVPAGTLDSSDEVLVGYSGSAYLRIDKTTGATQQLGDLNPNTTEKTWISSGDVVSIIGAATYLTASLLSGSSSSTDGDFIIQVDPKTGTALKILGPTHFEQLWGLGYWGGIAYGFSATGKLCAIDLTTGSGTGITIPNLATDTQFWGAGVTTAAPITLPH
jgi:hypothetical protein